MVFKILILLIVPGSFLYSAPPEIESLLDFARSFNFLTKVAEKENNAEKYALNIISWQMVHGGFSKARSDDYKNPWDGVVDLSVKIVDDTMAVGMFDNLATVGEAGTATAGRTVGAIGRVLVTILILLAMLGSINGSVMTGSRIAMAMAEQGHAPAAAERTHRVFGTPVVALWGQAAWTLVLLSWQGFEQLMDYTSSAMLITGCLTVSAVIVLRRRMPEQSRPYKVWGYPWPPIFYVLSSAAVLTVSIVHWDPSVFLAVLWFAGALAVHRFLVR